MPKVKSNFSLQVKYRASKQWKELLKELTNSGFLDLGKVSEAEFHRICIIKWIENNTQWFKNQHKELNKIPEVKEYLKHMDKLKKLKDDMNNTFGYKF